MKSSLKTTRDIAFKDVSTHDEGSHVDGGEMRGATDAVDEKAVGFIWPSTAWQQREGWFLPLHNGG